MTPLKFNFFTQSFLGIDVGTSTIKLVELSKIGKRIKLENYGEIHAPAFYDKPFRKFQKSTLYLSTDEIAKGIRGVLEETKIKTRKAAFSIPDYSTFFTWFDLPSMSKEELPEAVKYEARQHIPLNLSEVTLDWQVIEGRVSEKEKEKIKILLVAVPNDVISQYYQLAEAAKLQLQGLEAEVFAFCRSSLENGDRTVALVDIGARSTTCSIVDGGILKRSYSFDVSGSEFTDLIAKSLNMDYYKAEELKGEQNFLSSDENISKILYPLIDVIINEVHTVCQNFLSTENRDVKKIILGGGTALLPGLKEYFSKNTEKEVVIAQPFSNIFYPPILEETVKKMNPTFAIAAGAALWGLK